jgi:transposase
VYPLLIERLKRLRTISGVGAITALTWALEISHASSRSNGHQLLREKSSADKQIRMPISKQKNKHIQQVLVEAAKLAPRYNHELALVYEQEQLRGNKNRATLAVARKIVAYMLAVERRKQDFVPAEESGGTMAA